VGNKTFVQRNGVWTDAEYDPSKMTTIKVGFGSDDYFKLIAARPEWGQFFALGERVIVVLEGKAYETVQGAGQSVQIPPTLTPEPTRKPTLNATPVARVTSISPVATVTGSPPAATPTPGKPTSSGLCGGAAAMAMGVAAVVVMAWRARRSR
jgi:hypothetical protein